MKTKILLFLAAFFLAFNGVANGRLFVTKENRSTWEVSISELNKTTGEIIDTHVFSSPTINNTVRYLTYDVSTNEIYGITNGDQIIKYNIATKAETCFYLSDMYDWTSIIIVNDNTSEIGTILSNKGSKPIRAYNLFGQEVPLNTISQIIIVEYENGFREKVFGN